MDTPTVGRIVHYVSYGTPGGEYTSTCRAAIITQVSNGETREIRNGAGDVVATVFDDEPLVVDLCVMNPTGLFFNRCTYEHPDNGPNGVPRGGTWHWPERSE